MAPPNGTPYAGRAVVDDLEREIVRARLKRFLVAVIDAKGPKTVARDLTSRGWSYEEGTVRSWRGRKNPPPDVAFALAAMYGISLDEYALVTPQPDLAKRVQDLETTQDVMLNYLMGDPAFVDVIMKRRDEQRRKEAAG